MQSDYRSSIECLSRHGITMTAVWREKLDEVGTEVGAQILADNGVKALSLCAGGMLTQTSSSQRQQALDDNQRWLEQAAAIGADTLVVITGGLPDKGRDITAAREHALEGLYRLTPIAKACNIKLALEPLHPAVCGFRSVISSLREANDMLDNLASPDTLRIALDSYALWWDPNLEAEIKRAGSRISNFHVSDWLTPTNDVRLDRGMPGDGHIDNRKIRQWLESNQIILPVEVEIFSAQNWWTRDPNDVLEVLIDRASTHL